MDLWHQQYEFSKPSWFCEWVAPPKLKPLFTLSTIKCQIFLKNLSPSLSNRGLRISAHMTQTVLFKSPHFHLAFLSSDVISPSEKHWKIKNRMSWPDQLQQQQQREASTSRRSKNTLNGKTFQSWKNNHLTFFILGEKGSIWGLFNKTTDSLFKEKIGTIYVTVFSLNGSPKVKGKFAFKIMIPPYF